MTETPFNQNQTQFGSDAPILAKPFEPAKPISAAPPGSFWQRTPKWVIGLVAVLAILLVVLIYAINNRPAPQITEESLETETEVRELSPLEQRLQTARELLRQANPTVQELPFPPVDTTLRIDKAR